VRWAYEDFGMPDVYASLIQGTPDAQPLPDRTTSRPYAHTYPCAEQTDGNFETVLAPWSPFNTRESGTGTAGRVVSQDVHETGAGSNSFVFADNSSMPSPVDSFCRDVDNTTNEYYLHDKVGTIRPEDTYHGNFPANTIGYARDPAHYDQQSHFAVPEFIVHDCMANEQGNEHDDTAPQLRQDQ
jgi:hypothetical protein